MFKNVGKKIMMLAKICAWVSLVCSVVIGVVLALTEYSSILMLPLCILGGLLVVISCWPLYAFGQIVDDVTEIRRSLQQENAVSAVPSVPVFDNLPKL